MPCILLMYFGSAIILFLSFRLFEPSAAHGAEHGDGLILIPHEPPSPVSHERAHAEHGQAAWAFDRIHRIAFGDERHRIVFRVHFVVTFIGLPLWP